MSDGETDQRWYSEESATFGDRLADAREVMGLSQSELSERLGVKESTLDAWENDRTEPRANRLQMLSGLLNVSLRWLLTGEGEGVDPERAAMPRSNAAILAELRETRADLVRALDRLHLMEQRLVASEESGA